LWEQKNTPQISPLEPFKFKLTPNDCLIDMKKHAKLIMNWFDDKLLELNMIYRGTEHDFTTQSFDDHCINKGPTLTVIET
jgi:hypothetical protein